MSAQKHQCEVTVPYQKYKDAVDSRDACNKQHTQAMSQLEKENQQLRREKNFLEEQISHLRLSNAALEESQLRVVEEKEAMHTYYTATLEASSAEISHLRQANILQRRVVGLTSEYDPYYFS